MPKPDTYACEACANPIPQTPGTGRIKRWCSKPCRSDGRYRTRANPSTCQACGTSTGHPLRRMCLTCRSPQPKAPSTTYYAVHVRLRKARGRATEHTCPCGKQATEWSYNHDDPNELTGPTPRGVIAPYSLDFSHYTALCRSCHVKRDQNTYPNGLRVANEARRLAKVHGV